MHADCSVDQTFGWVFSSFSSSRTANFLVSFYLFECFQNSLPFYRFLWVSSLLILMHVTRLNVWLISFERHLRSFGLARVRKASNSTGFERTVVNSLADHFIGHLISTSGRRFATLKNSVLLFINTMFPIIDANYRVFLLVRSLCFLLRLWCANCESYSC